MRGRIGAALGLAAVALLGIGVAQAATTEVKVGDPLPRYDRLKPGTHRYIRVKVTDDTWTVNDVWTRDVRFETQNGLKRVHIVQHWDAAGAGNGRLDIDSWFEEKTLRPLTHVRKRTKDGQTVVEAFDFQSDKVTGLADVENNAVKDLNLALTKPTYNFEIDMEMFQTLPLAPGYEAKMNFYHPGGKGQGDYVFKVAGSDVITLPSGGRLDCWVVTTDYNAPERPLTKFWVAKDSQLVIKTVSELDARTKLMKLLID